MAGDGRKRARSGSKVRKAVVKYTPVVQVPRLHGVIAPKYICYVRYTDYPTLSLVSNYYYYNINSVKTCNQTLSLGPALGFAQLTNMYTKFRVDSCSVKITWDNRDAGALVQKGSMGPLANGTAAASRFTELPRSQSVILPYTNAGCPLAKQYAKYNMWDLCNVSKKDYQEEFGFYGFIATTDPVEVIRLAIGLEPWTSPVALATQVTVNVELTYQLCCWDPKDLNA